MFPEKIDLLAGMQERLPVGLNKSSECEELGFLDREVIPRLFAEVVALLAIVQAAAHMALSTTHFVSLLLVLPLSERETYLYVFERAKNQLFYALNDAQVGIGILYGWLDPTQVVDAAFPEEPPSEQPEPIAIALPAPPEPMRAVPPAEVEVAMEEVCQITFHSETEDPPASPPPAVEIVPRFHFDRLEEESSPSPTITQTVSSPPIEKPVLQPPPDPYASFSEPVEYVQGIEKMVPLLKNTSLAMLPFSGIKEIGAKVKSYNIHPLKFLECILRKPDLRSSLSKISIDKVPLLGCAKWNGFLWGKKMKKDKQPDIKEGGIGDELAQLALENKIEPYLPGFVKILQNHQLKVDPQMLNTHIEKRDWDNAIKYLIAL